MPKVLYTERGQDKNYIALIKNDFAADRTSNSDFQANHLRVFHAAVTYASHHTLCTDVLAHTELAQSQPSTVIVKLFKIAVRMVARTDRIKRYPPTDCPVASLLALVLSTCTA